MLDLAIKMPSFDFVNAISGDAEGQGGQSIQSRDCGRLKNRGGGEELQAARAGFLSQGALAVCSLMISVSLRGCC